MTKNRVRFLAIAASASLGLAACSDSSSADSGTDALVEYFVDQDAPRDEAECVAGELSEFDSDTVIAALEADDAPADAALVEAIFAAITTCGI